MSLEIRMKDATNIFYSLPNYWLASSWLFVAVIAWIALQNIQNNYSYYEQNKNSLKLSTALAHHKYSTSTQVEQIWINFKRNHLFTNKCKLHEMKTTFFGFFWWITIKEQKSDNFGFSTQLCVCRSPLCVEFHWTKQTQTVCTQPNHTRTVYVCIYV